MNTCARHFCDFETDALVINQHGATVIGNTFIDTCAANDPAIAAAAHRDAIQLIPPSLSMPREQFAAGVLHDVSVFGNRIGSVGKLQGIFGSDGAFNWLRLIGNVIDTQGQHYISISGLLSGWMEGNIKPDGTPCPIRLDPMRIGGNLGDGCVWVLGFANADYNYADVHEVVESVAIEAGVVVDVRTKPLLNKDVYLANFRVDEFRTAAQKLPEIRDINEHMRALKQLALKHGDLYGA